MAIFTSFIPYVALSLYAWIYMAEQSTVCSIAAFDSNNDVLSGKDMGYFTPKTTEQRSQYCIHNIYGQTMDTQSNEILVIEPSPLKVWFDGFLFDFLYLVNVHTLFYATFESLGMSLFYDAC